MTTTPLDLLTPTDPYSDRTWRLQLYVAEDRTGAMPWSDELPHRYVPKGDELELRGDELDDVLGEAFALANIADTDHPVHGRWVASYRDRDRARSLSVGDVITINGEAGRTCAPIGWRELTAEERAVLTEAVRP